MSTVGPSHAGSMQAERRGLWHRNTDGVTGLTWPGFSQHNLQSIGLYPAPRGFARSWHCLENILMAHQDTQKDSSG